MQKNDLLELRAETLGADLEGVCRHEGMPVFVPGLLPGESARVRIVKVEKRYAFGKLEALVPPLSEDRADSDCPAYPQCGGCTARHMKYEATLAAKRQNVQDCFQRIGHLAVSVPPVLGMENPHSYRNKTALPAGGTEKDPLLGFYAPRSHRLIPVLACPNAMNPTGEIALIFQRWMKNFHVSPYDEQTGGGLIRHVVIRVNRAQEAMVTVVARKKEIPHLPELCAALSAAHTVSIYLNINDRDTNVIFGDCFRLLSGRETLSDTLCGLRFELSPDSFFQINPAQTELLYKTALDFACLTPSDTLLDVYCGAGTISLMMAEHCRQVTGIEVVPAAIQNAKRNALQNHIRNAVFYEGKAEDLLPRMVREGNRPDVIVVDPPRKGLESQVVDAITQSSPSRLVYVSCNPATLARDAALLAQHGYEIARIQPIDMFPYTSHVETVVQLSQQKPDTYITVGLDLDELDATSAEKKATYEEIKAWVWEHHQLKVSSLYISQVKRKCGLEVGKNYNLSKSDNPKVPQCPKEKEDAIMEALRAFKMI